MTAFLLFIGACSQSGPATNKAIATNANTSAMANTDSPMNDSPVSGTANDGKELYASKCTICHKDTGKGGKVTVAGKNIKPADLTSERMKSRPDEKWLEMISEGDPDEGMPAFKEKLTPEQIKAVVRYVKQLP